jgi:hypothetical protein
VSGTLSFSLCYAVIKYDIDAAHVIASSLCRHAQMNQRSHTQKKKDTKRTRPKHSALIKGRAKKESSRHTKRERSTQT